MGENLRAAAGLRAVVTNETNFCSSASACKSTDENKMSTAAVGVVIVDVVVGVVVACVVAAGVAGVAGGVVVTIVVGVGCGVVVASVSNLPNRYIG